MHVCLCDCVCGVSDVCGVCDGVFDVCATLMCDGVSMHACVVCVPHSVWACMCGV